MSKMKNLEETILSAQRERLELALAAGCTSIRTIAQHLGTSPSRTHRMLRDLGYSPKGGWKKGKA